MSWAEDASKKRTQLEPMQNYVRTHGHNERSRSLVLKLSVLSGISGSARFLWIHTFGSERDLWGCSFSMVAKFSVLSGISGGARFALFSDLSLSVLVLVSTVARMERGT